MTDGSDAECVSQVMETNAVIAYPRSKLRRVDVLQAPHVTLADFQIPRQCMEDTEGAVLIDGAQLCFGLVCPDNVLAHP